MNTEKYQSQLNRILTMAELEAERDQSGVVGIEHMLIAMHQEGGNLAHTMMTSHGITLERLRSRDIQQVKDEPKP